LKEQEIGRFASATYGALAPNLCLLQPITTRLTYWVEAQQNYEIALKFFKKAAEQGDEMAKDALKELIELM